MKTSILLLSLLVVFTIVEGQILTDPYGNVVGSGVVGTGFGGAPVATLGTTLGAPVATDPFGNVVGTSFGAPVSTIGTGLPVSTIGTGLPVSTFGTHVSTFGGPISTVGAASNGGSVFPPGLPPGKCYCQCPAGYQNGPAFFVGPHVPSFYATLQSSTVPSATSPYYGTGLPIGAYDPTTSGAVYGAGIPVGAYDPTTSGAIYGGVGYDPTTSGAIYGAGVPVGYDPTTSGAIYGGVGAYDPTTSGAVFGADPTSSGAIAGGFSAFAEVEDFDASRFGFRSYGMN